MPKIRNITWLSVALTALVVGAVGVIVGSRLADPEVESGSSTAPSATIAEPGGNSPSLSEDDRADAPELPPESAIETCQVPQPIPSRLELGNAEYLTVSGWPIVHANMDPRETLGVTVLHVDFSDVQGTQEDISQSAAQIAQLESWIAEVSRENVEVSLDFRDSWTSLGQPISAFAANFPRFCPHD